MRSALYHRAPERLRHAIAGATRHERRWRPRIAYAMAGLTAVAAILAIALRPRTEDLTLHDVIASHVRSTLVTHLTDVASSDRHTVKPWFAGKLDFSPSVVDLGAEGFPLAGGRLDYVASRPVAALVYHHGEHVINLLTWPSPAEDAAPRLQFRQGYTIFDWIHGGMSYWAISDLNANDLKRFVDLISTRR